MVILITDKSFFLTFFLIFQFLYKEKILSTIWMHHSFRFGSVYMPRETVGGPNISIAIKCIRITAVYDFTYSSNSLLCSSPRIWKSPGKVLRGKRSFKTANMTSAKYKAGYRLKFYSQKIYFWSKIQTSTNIDRFGADGYIDYCKYCLHIKTWLKICTFWSSDKTVSKFQ